VGVVEYHNAHAVLEVLGIRQVNEEPFLAKLVLWLLSCIIELRLELLKLFLRGNNCSTFFSDLVGSTWGLNLQIDLLSLGQYLVGLDLIESFFSDRGLMLFFFSFTELGNLINTLQQLATCHSKSLRLFSLGQFRWSC